jgi:hypothetical protein
VSRQRLVLHVSCAPVLKNDPGNRFTTIEQLGLPDPHIFGAPSYSRAIRLRTEAGPRSAFFPRLFVNLNNPQHFGEAEDVVSVRPCSRRPLERAKTT